MGHEGDEGESSKGHMQDKENDVTIWRDLLLHVHGISQARKGPTSKSAETRISKLTLQVAHTMCQALF